MISASKIPIETLADYEKLLDVVPHSHIDSYIINDLKKFLSERCKSIIVEYPYYESDYLSNYYIFYAKKLQNFSKTSYRLMFFSDSDASDLIGYMALRPTYEGTKCGRTYMEPEYLISESAHIIVSECKIHFRAGETVLYAFPHMKQEGDIAVCAHVALWSVVRSFTNRFHKYPEVRLGQLVEMIQPQAERLTPSRGLTPTQISDVLLRLGFSPIIRSCSDRNFIDEIYSYVESGIPVIGFMPELEHAITIVGCGMPVKELATSNQLTPHNYEIFIDQNGDTYQTNVIMASKLIKFLVVNDDNQFPYRLLNKGIREGELGYNLEAIKCAVIPLYSGIQLVYNDVKTAFLALVTDGVFDWMNPDKLITRIFLTSANTYREYVNEYRADFGSALSSILINLEMSKFVWCVEVSRPSAFVEGKVEAVVLVDSTSATTNRSPFLLITKNGRIDYSDGGKPVSYAWDRPLEVPAFHHNLQEVTPYGKD